MTDMGTVHFPEKNKQEWLNQILKDLKDRDPGSLIRQISGLDFPRFAHPEDLQPLPEALEHNQSRRGWEIAAQVTVKTVDVANAVALDELKGGATELWFDLDQDLNEDELNLLVNDIEPSYIGMHWRLGHQVDRASFYLWWAKRCSAQPPKSQSIGYFQNPSAASPYNAGSTLAIFGPEELAIPELSIAATKDWLHHVVSTLQEILTPKQRPLPVVRLITPVGADLLWETSRLRAMHILMAHIAEAFELPEDFYRLDAITATDILKMEPNDHKIATPVVAIAAISGNTDSVCLPIPLNIAEEKAAFHRRIARNVHHLLADESGMGLVNDPAAGSYFFESLTNTIAEACWKGLQSMND